MKVFVQDTVTLGGTPYKIVYIAYNGIQFYVGLNPITPKLKKQKKGEKVFKFPNSSSSSLNNNDRQYLIKTLFNKQEFFIGDF